MLLNKLMASAIALLISSAALASGSLIGTYEYKDYEYQKIEIVSIKDSLVVGFVIDEVMAVNRAFAGEIVKVPKAGVEYITDRKGEIFFIFENKLVTNSNAEYFKTK